MAKNKNKWPKSKKSTSKKFNGPHRNYNPPEKQQTSQNTIKEKIERFKKENNPIMLKLWKRINSKTKTDA